VADAGVDCAVCHQSTKQRLLLFAAADRRSGRVKSLSCVTMPSITLFAVAAAQNDEV